MKHYLLYSSDREHGGMCRHGIFESLEDANQHWQQLLDEEKIDSYYDIVFIECWENENLVNT